jgi:transposase
LVNDTTLLFGLDGVEVVRVVIGEDDNPLLALVTATEQAWCCPGCGARSQLAHSRVRTRPRDLPAAGRRTALTWSKRRWWCRDLACRRATFTESVPQIPPRARLTGRLRASIGTAVADKGHTVIQAARDHEVSWLVAQAAFTAHAKQALPAKSPPVAHLGIDEIRRGKARFRLVPGQGGDTWDVVTDQWHVGFTDLAGGAGLIGQVEGRTGAAVSADRGAVGGVAGRGAGGGDRHVHRVQVRDPHQPAARRARGRPLPRRAIGERGADRGAPPGHRAAARTPRAQGQSRMGAAQPPDPVCGPDAR